MAHMIYISADGDNVGHLVGASAFNDQEPELIQLSQKLEQGEQLFRDFAISSGGRLISASGDEARLVVPAEAATKIEDLREQYRQLTGASISVGLGMTLAQAEKSLCAAKLRGKDQIALYDDSVEQDLTNIHDPSEDEKIEDNYINPQDDVIEPEHNDQVADVGTNELDQQLKDVNDGLDTHTLDGQLEMLAEEEKKHTLDGQLEHINDQMGPLPRQPPVEQPVGQEQPQELPPEQGQEPVQETPQQGAVSVLELIADTLTKVKEHASFIEGLKTANPKAYEAIKGIVQAMLAMSHELMGPSDDGQQPQEDQGQSTDDSSGNSGRTGASNPSNGNHRPNFPVGTVIGDRIKVKFNDGSTGWRKIGAGQVLGSNGTGISARTTKQSSFYKE